MTEYTHTKLLKKFFIRKTKSSFINQKHELWLKTQQGFNVPIEFFT